MRKIELKSRKLLRAIFGSISFTAIAFVFQACYGTDIDSFFDVKITGTIKSKTTKLPIKGIKVTVKSEFNHGLTDEDGNFNFYASIPYHNYYNDSAYDTPDSVRIRFLDIDGIENGNFKDTSIIINPLNKDEVKIYIELEEQK